MHFRVDSFLSAVTDFSLPVSEALSLRPGEILKGLVLHLKAPGTFIVQLKGKAVEARSELPLKAGQELTFRVEGIREGRVFLKIMEQDKAKVWEESKLDGILMELGVKPSAETRGALRELIWQRLPVSKENVIWLSQTAEAAGEEPEVARQIALLLMKVGAQKLPAELVRALSQFLTLPTHTAQNLEEAMSCLSHLAPYYSLTDEQLNEDSRSSLPSIGLAFMEKELEAEEKLPAAKANFEIERPKLEKRIVELIRLVFQDMVESEEPGLAQRLVKMPDRQKDYFKALEIAEKVLAEKGMDLLPVKKAGELVKQAKNEVLGQLVFNSLDTPTIDPPLDYYYFAFPFARQGGWDQIEVRIWKDKNKPSLAEADEIKVDIFLDTASLGKILFQVVWLREGLLTLRATVEREDTRDLFLNRLDQLTGPLEMLGFSVQVSDIKLAPLKGDLRPRVEKEPETRPHYWGIDVLV